ncbi:MAG TPA: GNAT family N-acetyltransferase [Bryobacteraceae bacterium]|nr:GNAT family N-acetyltransferase [Bryobacteraceae bacterium]
MPSPLRLRFHPLTPGRWNDFETLFGERGACGGCWCMWPRLARPEFQKQQGAGNKRAMNKIVESGPPPGLLAYAGHQAVAWCALAPRGTYRVLANSRILKPVDGRPVWSVVCFFVAKPFRRRGITTKLLEAAATYARKHGARIIEGYPVEPKTGVRSPDVFVWTGLPSAFVKAGFAEVARRSSARPIMRREL